MAQCNLARVLWQICNKNHPVKVQNTDKRVAILIARNRHKQCFFVVVLVRKELAIVPMEKYFETDTIGLDVRL